MENKDFTAQQSLSVIHEMITKAKQQIHDNGFFLLLWGWLVFISAIAHYIMMTVFHYEYAFITWPVLMGIGAIVSMIYGARSEKKAKGAKTWIDKGLTYLWGGFLISLFITLGVSAEVGFEVTYPFMMILYGMGTFVYGGMMGFRPLIIGGIFSWAFAVVAFFTDFEYQLLLLAGAILTSYIIPGYILQINYKKHVQGA